MEHESDKTSPWDRVKRHWVCSLGVQAWLIEAARGAIRGRLETLLAHLDPQNGPAGAASGTNSPGTLPDDLRSPEGLGFLIESLKKALMQLDDVQDYALVEALDNQMYQLWKELERTMQRHRRSEARFQLKEMFRI